MKKLINIGYGNVVNCDKIVSVISPDSAPIRRLVQNSKDNQTAVDATHGRRTRAVIITDSGHVILSALTTDTISERYSEAYSEENYNEK